MSLSGEVFSGGATTSQHIEAQDDDHFENTTFKLKRTRSMGLLDEFIPDKLKEQDGNNSEANSSTTAASTSSSGNLAAMAAMASQTNSSYVNETPSSQHHETIESISNNSDGDVTHSSDVAPSSTSPVNSPSPTSSPALDLKSPELLPHDDTDLAVEPSRHVDYLSHQWDVSDIWKSWRYVISKRKDVANAARLENASWRTWAQRRSNLKTISPEVVNWSKDSDVTWLYGPILKDDDHVNNENHDSDAIETTATSSVAGDISIAKKCSSKNGPKPILKKRTMEQSMISHSNLLKLQLATQIHQKKREQKLKQQEELKRQHQLNHPDEYFDPEALSNKLNSQYKNTAPTHNTSVAKLQSLLKTPNSSSSASLKDLMKDEAVVVPSSEQISHDQNQEDGNVSGDVESKGERHIHFNDEVMQCIAIDVYSDDEQRYNSDEEDYDSDDDDDDYYDQYEPSNDSLAQSHLYEGDDESIEEADEKVEDDEDGSEDEEDDEGGFFLNVKSNSNAPIILGQHSSASTSTPVAPSLSRHTDITDDTASISTTNSKSYKTIQLLPSTSINYGSDESSDEANPYTSSLSHNVNNDISRGYDYYYDYNTVYTCNPNNSVYASYQSPDVVDVPENLDMGSNFDYEFIENNDSIPVVDTTFENNSTINNMPISYSSPSSPLSVAISGGGKNSGVTVNSPNFPIVNVNSNPQQQQQSQAKTKPKAKASPFQLSDSEDDSNSDSDDDGISGLSIGTRRSSQALAESVFQSSLTSSTQETAPQHFPDTKEVEPVAEHVSSINPRYSSTSISKQPTSSSSLSQSFFGGAGGLSSTDKELSKSFLGGSTSASTSTSHDEKTTTTDSSSTGFFQVPNRDYTPSPDNNTLTRTLSNTSKKSSPLPPQTTSENAFRGDGQQSQSQSQSQSQLPSQQQSQPRRGLLFDEEDSEDSEDEGMVIGGKREEKKLHGQGYNALSQVAGRNGIHSPSPQFGNASAHLQDQDQGHENEHEHEHEENHKNLVGQARGLAKHFFG
ncbi:hypothetical protein MGS_01527 [Candida albicans P78042]|nr:hypothetical protein MGS_01527 [Candida albicans P78042]